MAGFQPAVAALAAPACLVFLLAGSLNADYQAGLDAYTEGAYRDINKTLRGIPTDATAVKNVDYTKDIPIDDAVAGILNVDREGIALIIHQLCYWQVIEVILRVKLLLPAIGIEILAKIALAIEQADCYERQAEVAGCFEVIAREDAETAAVDRQ